MKRRFLFAILSLSGCLLSSCELFETNSSFSKGSEDSSFRDSSVEKESSSSDSTNDSLPSSSASHSEGSSSSSSDFSDEDDLGYSYMYFGTERYLGDNQNGDFIFDSNGLNIVSMSSENVFFDAEEKEPTSAIRIGSSDDYGILNIAFEEPMEIQDVYLMAFTDASEATIKCAVASSSLSALVKQNSPLPASNYDYRSLGWTPFSFHGDSTSFLSLSTVSERSDKCVFLSKVVIVSKKDGNSSGETSSESSQGSSSSSSMSQGGHPLPDGAYRLPRIKVSGDSADIYQVNRLSGNTYSCTVAKTITKGNEYFEPEDIAAYYQAFDSFPVNYCYGTSSNAAKDEALGYGKNGRCYFQYRYGSYHKNDYTPPLGPWLKTGVPYYELDISTTSYNPNYNNGKRISRGTYRIVILPKESSISYPNEDSYDSICFFTKDHYDTFVEYYNYYDGWGSSFVGANGSTRPSVTTIPLI